jgi:hypothetical protein
LLTAGRGIEESSVFKFAVRVNQTHVELQFGNGAATGGNRSIHMINSFVNDTGGTGSSL